MKSGKDREQLIRFCDMGGLFELVRRGDDDVKHQLGSAQNVSSRSTKIRGGPDWSI